MKKTKTCTRVSLLQYLTDGGGRLHAKHLDRTARSLASKMSMDGLVRWEKPTHDRSRSLNNYTLHITEAGAQFLEKNR